MEEDHEITERRISTANGKLVREFSEYLAGKKLTSKTIDKHCSNIEFYGNDYLLYYEAVTLDEGADMIGGFLGSWFIRKCLWSSEASMMQYITSFKKFYGWMLKTGKIQKDDYDYFLQIIKEDKNEWLETIQKYNDPSADFEDVFPGCF